MKKAKERVIFDNYNMYSDEFIEEAKEVLLDRGIENPTEDQIYDEIYYYHEYWYQDEMEQLKQFFQDETVIITGTVGTWRGRMKGGAVGTFEDVFSKAIIDCDYIKLWDENGHLYIKSSHHDGTNYYEVKVLNEKGINYLYNWENTWRDPREEEYVHDNIMAYYSTLPHYAHKQWGCKIREYEKEAI